MNGWRFYARRSALSVIWTGVIYHGNRLLPGVKEFVEWLYREKKRFLFLTNSSERTPREPTAEAGANGA